MIGGRMLTALALAAAMLFPPLTVRITAAPDVSRSLVARVVEEADAIWRPAGLCVSWRHADIDKDDIEPATVHVIIDDSAGPMLDVGLALGWTLVSDDGASAVIHVYGRRLDVVLVRSE